MSITSASSILESRLDWERIKFDQPPGSPVSETDLVWQFFSHNPQTDFYDRNDPLVKAMLRTARADTDPGLLKDLGETYMLTPGHNELASELFREAIDKSEQNGTPPTCPHQGLGVIAFVNGDVQTGIEQLEIYLKNAERLGSNDAGTRSSYWRLGLAYSKQGRLDKARQRIETFGERVTKNYNRAIANAMLSSIAIRQMQDYDTNPHTS
ncbi:MAG: tetratricopeptide repeat protein [Candidatus Alcyoniella australis]|nr:tetratricopeptide repeat protein [Candidatus Alcyoniella australis]